MGLRGVQFFPSSREMSVPLGPTVIQSFWVGVVGYGGAVAVGWGLGGLSTSDRTISRDCRRRYEAVVVGFTIIAADDHDVSVDLIDPTMR